MQKGYKSWFFRFVLLIWYCKKDLRSCSSSQRFSDLKTNLILKIAMDWLISEKTRKEICLSIHATVNKKSCSGKPLRRGSSYQQYHLKLCANLPLQLQDNFLRSSKCKTSGESWSLFRVASSRGKYYTNSKPSVLSVHRVGGRKNMFTTWLTVLCVR